MHARIITVTKSHSLTTRTLLQALQAAVQRIHSYVSELESKVAASEKKR
jgi:hypothetical protein